MPEESAGERTIPASPRKRQREREEGKVARSSDLNSAWTMLASLLGLWLLGPGVFRQMLLAMKRFLADAGDAIVDPGTVQWIAVDTILYAARAVLPLMTVLLIAGVSINLLQVGLLYSPKAMQPKFNRLNPITGMRRFVSIRALVEFIKSLLKIIIVTYIVYTTMRGRWEDMMNLFFLTPVGITMAMAELIGIVWFRITLAMIVLGILDYAFQRYQHERDLMMTQHESREEHRQQEGDPRVRQRIRGLQRQMAMQRMMGDVPTADVIVTNPTRYAVALRYDAGSMQAPVVVAKGARLVAERIRSLAVEHSVPIVEKPELARMLYRQINVNEAVPEDLFRAVAEVLAYVYQIDRRVEKVRERTDLYETAPMAM
jgi:flagellar biosynthesis protein FlhB